MHILRWLLGRPILLAWLLAILAILLNFSLGGRKSEEQPQHAAAKPAVSVPVVAQAAVVAPAPAAVAQAAAPVAAPAPMVTEATAPAAPAPAPVVAEATAPAAPAPAAADPAQAAAPASNDDLLRAAREAYWSNEWDRSAEFYNTLLKQAPDSLEYKGELANVYWKQGNSQKAAALFVEIAPKLAAQGRSAEAFNMKLYVEMVDPELAKTMAAAMGK